MQPLGNVRGQLLIPFWDFSPREEEEDKNGNEIDELVITGIDHCVWQEGS